MTKAKPIEKIDYKGRTWEVHNGTYTLINENEITDVSILK